MNKYESHGHSHHSHVMQRMRKMKNREVGEQEEGQKADKEEEAKEMLKRMPEQEILNTIEQRQEVKVHKNQINFNKLSDWFDRESLSNFRIILKQKSPANKLQIKGEAKSPGQPIPNGKSKSQRPPQSSHSSRPKPYLQANSRNKVSTQSQMKRQIQKITNKDIDNLIKQVMHDREQQYARIVSFDLAKNFPHTLKPKSHPRTPSSSLSRSKLFRNSMTLDTARQQQTLDLYQYFPTRKHRRTGSMRCNHTNPFAEKSKTIETPINIHDVKKILQRYRRDSKMRVSYSQSPTAREQQQQQQEEEVGVIGRRIVRPAR